MDEVEQAGTLPFIPSGSIGQCIPICQDDQHAQGQGDRASMSFHDIDVHTVLKTLSAWVAEHRHDAVV